MVPVLGLFLVQARQPRNSKPKRLCFEAPRSKETSSSVVDPLLPTAHRPEESFRLG
jgi:hypothetical protein